MQTFYKTERLLLRPLSSADAAFILELVNTPGWIKFIGDRNVKNLADADTYIQKIIGNPDVEYRVATLLHEQTAIGVISFIKRSYLDHHDIGFAFLPGYAGKGYAYEASETVLTSLLQSTEHKTILATTLIDNHLSIQLLQKLGFVFSKEITNENDRLRLYTISAKPQIIFTRTDSEDPAFQNLVSLLDADLAIRDGEEHAFYAQFNKTTAIRHAVVCYMDEKPVACGAFKKFENEKAEIKRMFVLPPYRGRRLGLGVLKELEFWAAEEKYSACILETGKKQPEAIRLYQKAGYSVIPNYGQYQGIENSVCMMKELKPNN